jgi:hypothetical protein
MRRKQLKGINEKIASLFLVCLISLAITGYAYSHWTDILTIFGNIQTGNLKITIDNEKFICDYTIHTSKLNNKTVNILADITANWEIWVGIIIKNKGTVPATINYEITTNNQPYESYFENDTRFYGPYTTTPPHELWEGFDPLNPPPGETPPIELPTNNRLVVWQKLWLTDAPPEDFSITITSEYKATLGIWHSEVAVIYYLDKT